MFEFTSFFDNSYTSSLTGGSQRSWDDELQNILTVISEVSNARLTEPYTEEEVRRALFQMHPEKAPGVDGFSAMFYHKFWGLIKDDVCSVVLNFLNHGILDAT